MYADGRGVAQDDKAAVQGYRRAAEQGLAEAQYFLGWMYAGGHGILKDDIFAHMWAHMAAMNWRARVKKRGAELKEKLAARMTPEQIAEAQKLARVAEGRKLMPVC